MYFRGKKMNTFNYLVVTGSLTGFNSNQSKYFPTCNRNKSHVQRHIAHLTAPTIGSHLPDQLSSVKPWYTQICSQELWLWEPVHPAQAHYDVLQRTERRLYQTGVFINFALLQTDRKNTAVESVQYIRMRCLKLSIDPALL